MKAEWSNKDSLEMPTTTMSDYIKREDAIRANENYVPYQRLGEDRQLYMDRLLKELPSADVVKVVRCRDCKKRNTRTCMMNNNVGMNKDLFDDDYCSYGERRKQEHHE